MKTVTVTIGGMSCQGCVNAVRNVLSRLDNVRVEQVDVGRAVLTVVGQEPVREGIEAAVRRAGFTVDAVDGLG